MRLYIFMSADYRRNLDRNGAPTKAFEPSLFVCATVMSRPTRTARFSGDPVEVLPVAHCAFTGAVRAACAGTLA